MRLMRYRIVSATKAPRKAAIELSKYELLPKLSARNGAKRADEDVDDDTFVAVGANGQAAHPANECSKQQSQDYGQRNSLHSVESRH